MTTEGEQQEAVCGTLPSDETWAGTGACILAPDHHGTHYNGSYEWRRIPAPVVPSDDEARFRCAGCGVRLRDADLISTSGKGGRRDAHLITGSVPDYCGPVNDVAPAPPTPSQDAEGDGLLSARKFMRDWLADCGLPYDKQDSHFGVDESLAKFEASARAEVIREVDSWLDDGIAYREASGDDAVVSAFKTLKLFIARLRALSQGGEGEAR